MEEVWRSYGPLEPIGPEADQARRRRRRGAIAAGVVGVCAAGAAAGLYLKPNLEPTPREVARRDSQPAAAPGPGPDRLAEAEALQAELGSALDEAGLYPAAVTGPAGGPVSAPPPPPSYAPPAVAPPPPSPPLSIGQRAAAVYRSIVTPSEPQARPAPPPPPRVVRAPPPAAVAAPRPPAPVVTVPPPRYAPPPRVVPLPRQEIQPEPIEPPPPIIAPAPPPRGPSFDCRTVRSAAEDMVCSDPRLADLDRRMAAELMGAMAAGHHPDLLLRDQNDWLARRDRAAPDPRAVADAYQRRIGQLRSMQ